VLAGCAGASGQGCKLAGATDGAPIWGAGPAWGAGPGLRCRPGPL